MISRGSEKAFQRTVAKNFKKLNYPIVMEEIEGCTKPGIPDCYYTINRNITGWIEYKYCKSYFSQIHFDIGQRKFFKRHGMFGARCFLFIKHAGLSTYYIFDWVSALKLNFNGNEDDYIKSMSRIIWKPHIDYYQLFTTLGGFNEA